MRYGETTKVVGHVDVDAGILWLGDPCYILPDKGKPAEFTYDQLLAIFDQQEKQTGKYPHVTTIQHNGTLGDKEHEGKGVVVGTGYGDGTYPVTATFNREGRVVRVSVDFDAEPEEEDD